MIEDQKQKEKKHKGLINQIKKQIITQDINDIRVSYSELTKKSASGLSKNVRYFFLFHKSRIGYINQLPKQTFLPFETVQSLPKLKAVIPLGDIKKVRDKAGVLEIEFVQNKKNQMWSFTASSPEMAKNWVRMIKSSARQLKQDINNPAQTIKLDKNNEGTEMQKSEISAMQEKSKSNTNFNRDGEKSKDGEKPARDLRDDKILGVNEQNQNENNLPTFNEEVGNGFKEEERKSKKQRFEQEQIQIQKNEQIPIFGNPIQKPTSTLFVGGVAVNNEKDQVQLKNKMETFENLTSKIRKQYERKRIEQSKVKQQVLNQSYQFNPGLGKNLFSFLTDTKLQIQKLERQWAYEFAKSQNEFQIITKFKGYVQAVSRRIIDQLGLEDKKRYYQPHDASNSSIKYQINKVLFTIFLTELKQVASSPFTYSEKGTIVNNSEEKMASQQFKNYDYVLRVTKNKGKIRVPLSMITHYKGFAVFAKVLIPSTESYDNMGLLEKQLEALQAESRIDNSIFQDSDENGRIVALQSKVFQKLARSQNSNKKFDLCFIQDLKYYLPHDLNNFSKQKPHQRLRWQLLQDDQCQDQTFLGEDMSALNNRLKIPQDLRDGINKVTQLSKSIIDRINVLSNMLESIDEYFTNSNQLSQILHKSGINVRYMGLLAQKCKSNWLKEILFSQIAVRCCKKYLSFDLQDCILNLNQSNIENVYKFHQKQIIKFLNKMFGNSQQTDIFWKQLNRQSQNQYKVSINREEINHEYILQSLQVQCCFKLKNLQAVRDEEEGKNKNSSILGFGKNSRLGNTTQQKNKEGYYKHNIQLFNSPSPFSLSHFASFEHRSKIYNMQFTQLYSSLNAIISQLSQQSFQQLKIILNIPRNDTIPSHIVHSSIYEPLMSYLINWISPKQMPSLYDTGQIQIGQLLPSRLVYQIKLAQLRWSLKENLVEDADSIKDWIVQNVTRWIGQCHPILTQLYEIYANYYMTKKNEQKKAVNFCKSAIKNQEQLIGQNHHKMADSYYLLGTIYRIFNKKLQALNSFKKSKEIIQKTQNQQSEAYGEVCIKMAQLYLYLNQLDSAVNTSLQAIKVLQNYSNQDSLVEAIQLVARCYEVQQDWENYINFIQTFVLNIVNQFKDNVQLLQRVVKICILPNLKIISEGNSTVAQKILKIISELPETTRTPNMVYNFLRVRMEDKNFPHRFIESLDNIEEILEEVEKNGMVARWKGFQNLSNKSLLNKVGVNMQSRGFNFIATLEALNIFVGNSFIQGILLDL